MLMDHTFRNMSCIVQLTASRTVVPSYGELFIQLQNGMSVNIKNSCHVFALVAISETPRNYVTIIIIIIIIIIIKRCNCSVTYVWKYF
jgi:hypothetical protein